MGTSPGHPGPEDRPPRGRGRPPMMRTPKAPETMTDEDLEVLQAVDRFRQRAGTHFCTVLQIFEVIRGLGYERTRR